MKLLTQLDIYNAYNYYHLSGAKRKLNDSEVAFYNYCCDNHKEICPDDTSDILRSIRIDATKLYSEID